MTSGTANDTPGGRTVALHGPSADLSWIAGGIGMTPFMSWIRSLDGAFDRDVDFCYSVRGPADAVYRDEIEHAAQKHPSLRLHLVLSDVEGPLTADAVLYGVAPDASPWSACAALRR